MTNERTEPISWREWWRDLIRSLIWAGVTLFGLSWVGKPLAQGLSQWMTRADPNQFLKALFSFPTATLLIFLFIGVKRWKSLVHVITKAVTEGKVESIFSVIKFQSKSVPTETLPQNATRIPTKQISPVEPFEVTTNKENL